MVYCQKAEEGEEKAEREERRNPTSHINPFVYRANFIGIIHDSIEVLLCSFMPLKLEG